jgi:hypothetical protein
MEHATFAYGSNFDFIYIFLVFNLTGICFSFLINNLQLDKSVIGIILQIHLKISNFISSESV